MEYFYHYTTLERWKKIQKEGLQPGRSIVTDEAPDVKDFPDFAHKPAIFGLPSPAPEGWLAYKVNISSAAPLYPTLTMLVDHISRRNSYDDIVLLKVRLQPDDDVRVGDYERIWKAYETDYSWPAAMVDYCRLVTKLRDNFNAVSAKKIPEVLCFNAIPASRIEFVEQTLVRDVDEIDSYLERKKNQELSPKAATRSPPAAVSARPTRSVP